MNITHCEDCRKDLTLDEVSYYFLEVRSMRAKALCRDCNLDRLERIKVAKELRKLKR